MEDTVYPSICTPGHVYKPNSGYAYAVELVFLNEAARDSKILPPYFWRHPNYKSKYSKYVGIVRKAIKSTSLNSVLAAITINKLFFLTWANLLFHAKEEYKKELVAQVILLPHEEIAPSHAKSENFLTKPIKSIKSFKDMMN